MYTQNIYYEANETMKIDEREIEFGDGEGIATLVQYFDALSNECIRGRIDMYGETWDISMKIETVKETKDSEKIVGKISIQVATPWGDQEYFVMEDNIIIHSSLSGQYFLLEKLDKETGKVMSDKQMSATDREAILQETYRTYTVTEFLPTKFYPALDSGGDIRS